MRALLLLLLVACDEGRAQAVCALIDTSGTYLDQIDESSRVLRRAVLPHMKPGDSLVVVKIASDSYNKNNVHAAVTLDGRPSQANLQKSQLASSLASLPDNVQRARHTDIRGGMMLCSEYLAELNAAQKVIVVFSDMKEDLPYGYERQFAEGELKGVAVVAMNVKRLKEDGAKPAEYRARLSAWESLVKSKGSKDWRVIMEPEKLVAFLDGQR